MLLRLPGSKGSLGIGHENKCLLEQSAGATGIQRTKFRPYAWTGKQSKGRLDLLCKSIKWCCVREMLCPGKSGISFSVVFLLFFFSPGSLKLSLLMESLRVVLFISVFTISILVLFPFLLSLPFFPFYTPTSTCYLSYRTFSLCSSFSPTCGHPTQFPCRLSMIFPSFLCFCSSASFFLLSFIISLF